MLNKLLLNEFNQSILRHLIRSQTSFFKKQPDRTRRDHLPIEAIRASSQDFNQSIFRTLIRAGDSNFWSSGPSDTPDAREFLVYKIKDQQRELEESKESVASPA